MADQFILDQIPIVEAQIIAYQEAALQLASGKIQSFRLNTGQSDETVTKFNIGTLQSAIDSLYNRRATLRASCGLGEAQLIGKPAW